MRQTDDMISQIADARTQVDELKNKQFTGQQSLTVHEIFTGQQWDINQTFSTGGGGGSPTIKFWFTADHQIGPLVAWRPYVLVDGSEWTLPDRRFTQEPVAATQFVNLTDDEMSRTSIVQYDMFSSTLVTVQLQLQMRVLANDTGTIGMVLL